MGQIRRKVEGYTGIYYQIARRLGGKGEEKVFFYTFKNKNGKKIWEKAGRQFADNMTPAKAATKRAMRIEGKVESPQEKRTKAKAQKQAKTDKWTIDRLWTEYASLKDDNKSFKTDKGRYELYLKDSFGDKEPQEIISLEVERLTRKLSKKKSPQTVKHILALLKRIIKYGTDKGHCSGTGFAIKLPKVSNLKTEFLAEDELRRLMEAIEADSHPLAGPIMLMALNTGMRRGELFKLKWHDVDFENGVITLRSPKGGTDQKIPLNDGARQVLESIHQTRSPYVFAGRDGKQRVDINKALAKIKKAAGLPKDFRPLHGLRHHYASMLASSGKVTPFALQRLLTHKDLRMTARYSHLSDKVLKDAAGVASDIIAEAMKGDKVAKIK